MPTGLPRRVMVTGCSEIFFNQCDRRLCISVMETCISLPSIQARTLDNYIGPNTTCQITLGAGAIGLGRPCLPHPAAGTPNPLERFFLFQVTNSFGLDSSQGNRIYYVKYQLMLNQWPGNTPFWGQNHKRLNALPPIQGSNSPMQTDSLIIFNCNFT